MSDIFDKAEGTSPEAQSPVDQETTQPATPQVSVEYKGRNWNQDEIVNKFQNADSYIKELTDKVSALEQEVQKGATLGEVLDQMNTSSQPTEAKEAITPQVKEVDVEAMVQKAVQKTKAEEASQANLVDCITSFEGVYKDKAVEVLQAKATELEMSIEEAKELASKKPKAFKQMFLGQSTVNPVGNSKGTVNTQTINLNQSQQKRLVDMNQRELAEVASSMMRG